MGISARNELIELIHDQCEASRLSLAMPAESLVYVPTAERRVFRSEY
jgi:hypothetical protein